MKKHVALAALLAALAGPALAQPMAAPPGAAPMMAPMSPAQFRQMAMMSDLFEIESSRLALQRSRSPAVQRFASEMVQDHQATSAALNGGAAVASGGTLGGAVGGRSSAGSWAARWARPSARPPAPRPTSPARSATPRTP